MVTVYQAKGFTLIELMITIAIVGILAAIAIPAYQNYLRQARYSDIVLSMDPYKVAVAECINDNGATTGCNGGTNGIPANITAAEFQINSLIVVNGRITVTPVAANGILATDTLVLTPSVSAGNRVMWSRSGGAVTSGYVK